MTTELSCRDQWQDVVQTDQLSPLNSAPRTLKYWGRVLRDEHNILLFYYSLILASISWQIYFGSAPAIEFKPTRIAQLILTQLKSWPCLSSATFTIRSWSQPRKSQPRKRRTVCLLLCESIKTGRIPPGILCLLSIRIPMDLPAWSITPLPTNVTYRMSPERRATNFWPRKWSP